MGDRVMQLSVEKAPPSMDPIHHPWFACHICLLSRQGLIGLVSVCLVYRAKLSTKERGGDGEREVGGLYIKKWKLPQSRHLANGKPELLRFCCEE